MRETKHLSISINRPSNEVYKFTSNPENLPSWASGLSGSIQEMGDKWIGDSPMGKVKIRFADQNKFGTLDHEVVLDSGATFYNPMRVFPNDGASELIFTLFKTSDMTAEWVTKELKKLKAVLEK